MINCRSNEFPTFTSIAHEDGYVLESAEGSGVGLLIGTNSSFALRAGDDAQDKQYKAVVSFDTSSLPDNATILSAILKLKRGGLQGTNPFTTHGACYVDALSFINKTGKTQFRVYFEIDDNDDVGDVFLWWYSGDNATAGNRPVLEVIY